jgi:hypothetical protein
MQIKIEAWKLWPKGDVNRRLALCQDVKRPYPPPTTSTQILVLSLTGILCMRHRPDHVEFATSIFSSFH